MATLKSFFHVRMTCYWHSMGPQLFFRNLCCEEIRLRVRFHFPPHPPLRVLFETERLWHTMRILVKGLRPDTIQSTRQKLTAHKETQNVVTYCSPCFTYTGTYLKRERKNVNNYNKCNTDTVYHKVNEPAGWSKWHLLWHLRKAPASNLG